MQTPEVYIVDPECVFVRGLSHHPEAKVVSCFLVIRCAECTLDPFGVLLCISLKTGNAVMY